MKARAGWVMLLAFIGAVFLGIGTVVAEDKDGDGQEDKPADSDGDGKPDEPKPADADGDGKPDEAKPADADGDGKPDAPKDSDGDGTPDDKDPDTKDSDGDGIPDSKEDSDGDGIPNDKEDSDGDGTPDAQDPDNKDSDGDGTPDSKETDSAAGANADPNEDSDGDGTPDSKEDTDGDGIPDSAEDADGDGVDDKDEDSDGDGTPDIAEDSDGDGIPDMKEDADGDGVPDFRDDSDGDGVPDSEDMAGDVDGDGVLDSEEEFDEDDPPTDPFDADGDGTVEPEEAADRKEFVAFFDEIPNQPDDQALEKRAEGAELKASISVEQFQKGVNLVRKIVLGKMMTKIEKKTAKKMRTFSLIVVGISGLGIFLLLMPLFLGKKYPGQGKVLFKYSALAAVTFIVTVNLFGGVLYGLRTVQAGLSSYTNPSIAIANGTFDSLHDDAHKYITTGKELFLPTLEAMRKNPEEQPSVLILQNGQKIVKDAKVFLSIKDMIKRVDWLFQILPIILTIVTLILFVLAIKPTLVEIVKMPAQAAAGAGTVGKETVRRSMARVVGELKATICTIGVLVVLTLISSLVLGRISAPATGALLDYFARAVDYLQFAKDASSGMVFMSLFGVILFLVLNLAVLILSMAFFLGKCQKIFQQRFNEGTPLGTHARFFKWGTASALLVQLFPMLFALVVAKVIGVINDKIVEGEMTAENISYTKLMLVGPLLMVAAFMVVFWGVRGLKAIKFLATYKVKPKVPPGVAPQEPPR
jgi:hypothetical protein